MYLKYLLCSKNHHLSRFRWHQLGTNILKSFSPQSSVKKFLKFQSIKMSMTKSNLWGLATLLLKGPVTFSLKIVNFNSFILLWWKKCVKLVKKVILVINEVPTTYLWKKNEEKRPIFSHWAVAGKVL